MEPEVAELFPEEEVFSIVPVWLELIKQGKVGGVVGQDAVIPAGVVMDDCIVWPRTHVAPGTYRRCILTPRIVVQG